MDRRRQSDRRMRRRRRLCFSLTFSASRWTAFTVKSQWIITIRSLPLATHLHLGCGGSHGDGCDGMKMSGGLL